MQNYGAKKGCKTRLSQNENQYSNLSREWKKYKRAGKIIYRVKIEIFPCFNGYKLI